MKHLSAMLLSLALTGTAFAQEYDIVVEGTELSHLNYYDKAVDSYYDNDWVIWFTNGTYTMSLDIITGSRDKFAGTYTNADCYDNGTGLRTMADYVYYLDDLQFTITGSPTGIFEVTGTATLYNDGRTLKFHYIDELTNFTIPNGGWGTYFNPLKSYEMPDGVEGYNAFMEDGELNFVKFYEGGDVVPAGTPVVLSGDPGIYDVYFKEGGNAPKKTNLYGQADRTWYAVVDFDALYYGVGLDDSLFPASAGFYWQSANGASFIVKKSQVFLALPRESTSRNCFLFNNLSGISSLNAEATAPAPLFNLTGQRSLETKGLHIQQGQVKFVK